MANDSLHKPSFSATRKWAKALDVAASCAALLALVLMANYLASRHFKRFQWMADERYRLSPLTLRMLETLPTQVKVIVFFDPDHALFSPVKGLLNEYQLACSKLDVEFVDYLHAPGRAAWIKTQYKIVSATDENFVIFSSEGKPPRIVHEKELADYDLASVLAGREAKRTAFKGEQLFTSAIVGVTDPKALKAYYLQGHGEHNPVSEDDTTGYFKFARVLQDKNILLEPLSLLTNPALTGVKSGLERILANWGVAVGDQLVTDKAQAKAGQNQVLYVSDFGQHPIVRPLAGSRLAMVLPHAVRQAPGAARA